MQITATSKTGTEFELTMGRTADITATAKGVNLGSVELTGNRIDARFPTLIGGKSVRISAEFDGADADKVAALFAESAARIEAHSAELADEAAFRARVLKAMGE